MTFRLTTEAVAIVEATAKRLGISKTAALELYIRQQVPVQR